MLYGNNYPYLNIGSMVLKPDSRVFRKLMDTMATGEMDLDPATDYFEKGLQQPWLDHFFVKYFYR